MRFNDEQLRICANLAVHYDAWLACERTARDLSYRLYWKTSKDREYLIRLTGSDNRGTSLGPRSPETESVYADFVARKTAAASRLEETRATLATTGRLYKALRLPAIATPAAAVLREADLRGMLGRTLMVVGTTALAAYALELGTLFDTSLQATQDFDLAWSGKAETLAALGPAPLLSMLKAVDSTYTRNEERPFQARNAKAYEVELLVAPSLAAALPPAEPLRPSPLPEQEWLLGETRISHVVCALDGSAARVYCPDPRRFALQKLWMSKQAKRNALKRDKDRAQGMALLAALRDQPAWPLDAAFRATLPESLLDLPELPAA